MTCINKEKCGEVCSTANKNNKELPKIVGGFLNITQKCNLKCKYCFVVQQPIEMTYQVAQDSADFYANNAKESNDTPSINFFGGEPLLRWDDIIVPLTSYIREKYGKKFQLSMTTNGILLDREKLDFMKEHNIGCLFSIDGDKETQDINRPCHNGKGSFDILRDKIPMILEYYPNMTFRSTVDFDTVQHMAHNYKFAIEQGYTNVFMIPNVFSEWTEEQVETLREQVKEIGEIYMDLLREDKHVAFNHFRDAFKDIKKINRASRLGEDRNQNKHLPARGRCGLGGTKYGSIGASGDVYSCQEMTENPELGDMFTIGNIYTGISDEKRLEISNKLKPETITRSDGKSCDDCLYNKICSGDCTINNYFANENVNIMSALMCEYKQIVLQTAVSIMNTMAKEGNIMFKSIFGRS